MFLLSYLPVWGRGPAGAELRSAGQPRAAVPMRTGESGHSHSRLAIALAILAPLAISSSLRALPIPPGPPPALHTVRMVQQWIPMPDGVRLAATLYMPGDAKPGETFPALLEYLPC